MEGAVGIAAEQPLRRGGADGLIEPVSSGHIHKGLQIPGPGDKVAEHQGKLPPGDGGVGPEGGTRLAVQNAHGPKRLDRLGVPHVVGHVRKGHPGLRLLRQQAVEHLRHLSPGHVLAGVEQAVAGAVHILAVVPGIQGDSLIGGEGLVPPDLGGGRVHHRSVSAHPAHIAIGQRGDLIGGLPQLYLLGNGHAVHPIGDPTLPGGVHRVQGGILPQGDDAARLIFRKGVRQTGGPAHKSQRLTINPYRQLSRRQGQPLPLLRGHAVWKSSGTAVGVKPDPDPAVLLDIGAALDIQSRFRRLSGQSAAPAQQQGQG